MEFTVKAVWDEEAGVFYSDSNIIGLHIEAKTLDEFRATLADLAPELILTNHISPADLLGKPLKDIIPMVWSGASGDDLLQPSR